MHNTEDNFCCFISMLRTFRSGVELCHPRPPIFISKLRYARVCSSYGCFISRAIRLSNNLHKQGYVKDTCYCHCRNYMVDMGILSNNMKFPSHEYQMALCSLTIYNETLLRIRFETKSWPYYRSWLCIGLRVVSKEHLRRSWYANRIYHVPSPCIYCIYYSCWEQSLFKTCRYCPGLGHSNILVYFLNFA